MKITLVFSIIFIPMAFFTQGNWGVAAAVLWAFHLGHEVEAWLNDRKWRG